MSRFTGMQRGSRLEGEVLMDFSRRASDILPATVLNDLLSSIREGDLDEGGLMDMLRRVVD